MTPMQPLYQDPSDQTWKTASATAVSPGYKVEGVSTCTASAGQPIRVLVEDSGGVTAGGTLVANTIYVNGATAGSLHPASDNTTNWRGSVVGIATSTTVLKVFPLKGGKTRSDVAT